MLHSANSIKEGRKYYALETVGGIKTGIKIVLIKEITKTTIRASYWQRYTILEVLFSKKTGKQLRKHRADYQLELFDEEYKERKKDE